MKSPASPKKNSNINNHYLMKNILLVEDDSFIVDIYAKQFKKEGYHVDVALDGAAALEKIKNSKPDLLILDLLLPKIEGWEVLRHVRANPLTKDVKVIVISNLDLKENAENI